MNRDRSEIPVDELKTTSVNLKQRILLPQVVLIVFILIIFSLYGIHLLQKHQREEIVNQQFAVNTLYNQFVTEQGNILKALLGQLANTSPLQEAFLARDRELLVERSTEIYQRLNREYGITHLYFHLPDRHSYLRAHKPERYGDQIDRFTLIQATSTGEVSSGLELGPLGIFTLRVVLPWHINGETIGYLELGLEPGYILSQLKEILTVEIVQTINKDLVDRASWEDGQQMLNQKPEWELIDSEVVSETTIPAIKNKLIPQLTKTAFAKDKQIKLSVGFDNFIASELPLFDVSGKDVGRFIILSDITQSKRALYEGFGGMVLFSLIVGTGLFIVGYITIKQVEVALVRSRLKERQGFVRTVRARKALELEVQERMQAQAELEEAHQLLESRVEERTAQLSSQQILLENIIANIPSSIYWKDNSGLFLGANPRFLQLAGIKNSIQLVGSRLKDHHLTDEVQTIIEQRERQVLMTGVSILDKDTTFPGTSTEYYLHTVVPIYDAEGKVAGILGILKNITERRQSEILLTESEERFRKTFTSAQIGIVIARPDTTIIRSNDSFAKMLGYSPVQLLGVKIPSLIDPTHHEECDLFIHRLIAGEENGAMRGEKQFTHHDGSIIWGSIAIFLIRNRHGEPDQLVLEVENITERKRAEDELKENQQLLRSIIDLVPHMIFTKDRDGRFLLVNRATAEAYGQTVEKLTGVLQSDLHHSENEIDSYNQHDLEVINSFRDCIQSEEIFTDFSGNKRVLQVTKMPIISSALKTDAVLGVAVDITEAKQAEEEIRQLAFYDVLTGLPNRALFNDRLNNALSLAGREHRISALLFLDLDRFKLINDTMGHDAGDKLLQEVGCRLTGVVRESDTVARLGGDEFVILLPTLDHRESVLSVSKKILSEMSEPFNISSKELFMTTSIGIVFFPDDGNDAVTLLKRADVAMYDAKEKGRNTYSFYSEAMSQATEDRHQSITLLRHALEYKEFFLEYQPQYGSTKSEIVGIEALVRWQHPVNGTTLPEEFIPLAEEAGLSRDLGYWVLQEACRQNAQWQKSGLHNVPIAVSISTQLLKHQDLTSQIESILRETGLGARYLEIELTETTLLEERDRVAEVIKSLRKIGVRISVADFGTSYVSMHLLQQCPVDRIKVPQTFVQDIEDSSETILIDPIITLAQALDIDIVAEGVQTEKQYDFLRQECAYMQGSYFSNPLSAAEYEILLKNVDNES